MPQAAASRVGGSAAGTASPSQVPQSPAGSSNGAPGGSLAGYDSAASPTALGGGQQQPLPPQLQSAHPSISGAAGPAAASVAASAAAAAGDVFAPPVTDQHEHVCDALQQHLGVKLLVQSNEVRGQTAGGDGGGLAVDGAGHVVRGKSVCCGVSLSLLAGLCSVQPPGGPGPGPHRPLQVLVARAVCIVSAHAQLH